MDIDDRAAVYLNIPGLGLDAPGVETRSFSYRGFLSSGFGLSPGLFSSSTWLDYLGQYVFGEVSGSSASTWIRATEKLSYVRWGQQTSDPSTSFLEFTLTPGQSFQRGQPVILFIPTEVGVHVPTIGIRTDIYSDRQRFSLWTTAAAGPVPSSHPILINQGSWTGIGSFGGSPAIDFPSDSPTAGEPSLVRIRFTPLMPIAAGSYLLITLPQYLPQYAADYVNIISFQNPDIFQFLFYFSGYGLYGLFNEIPAETPINILIESSPPINLPPYGIGRWVLFLGCSNAGHG